ncbi:MAG TPA: hypothetical protein PLW68_03090 [Casimicrobiaceae bacterium]|nr:hypothetical protein [Casimicrobiaceae bacterium]
MMLGRAFVIWLAIILVESLHGILRGIFLLPVVGDLRARQIGVVIGSALILLVAYGSARWLRVQAPSTLLWIGAFWVALTVTFEIALGRLAMKLPWERILADYDVTRGGLMLFGLLFLWLSPLIAARLRTRSAHVVPDREG